MTSPHEVALLRVAAQRLDGDGFDTAAEVVEWLTCMQAQDFGGGLTSVALRMRGGDRSAVEAALDAGDVVRSWPMRGTLHLVPARDLPWMLGLAAPRVMSATARRRRDLGIDDDDIEAARATALDALSGGVALTREELLARVDAAGQSTSAQRGAHLLSHLAMSGVLCFGPVQGRHQQVVLLDEWVPDARRLGVDLGRDQALGEWASRYFRSHGPATAKDFTWWTKLLAADVTTAVEIARPGLVSVDVDGTEYLMDPATPDRLAARRRQARRPMLLPGFDEFVLGYADRSAALPDEFASRICPGGNGMFLGSVLSGGQLLGTWRREGSGSRRRVEATPFTSFPGQVESGLPRAAAALDRAAAGAG